MRGIVAQITGPVAASCGGCREGRSVNPTETEPFQAIALRRYSRRVVVRGAVGMAFGSALPSLLGGRTGLAASQGLAFEELSKGLDETHHVSTGYTAKPLIRWGDPVMPDAPLFDPLSQTAAAQELQFGYNCDFIAFLPLPKGSNAADHGLLAVNHEYTSTELMFPGVAGEGMADRIGKEQTEIELAAHGLSVVEIRRDASGSWAVVREGQRNRRITMRSTEIALSGPAAGHDRLKTSTDPYGRKVIGTLNNCAGGVTPWGTVLTAEENFNQYFAGDPSATAEAENHNRLGIANEPGYPWWGRYFARFDVAREPNEPNRFGWIVEIDPYDPRSTPIKRTALGRFKHEGAGVIVNTDGRIVLYSGDDQRFEYVYRYVSNGRFDPASPEANRRLLDEGALSVAKFRDDGTLIWMPLVHGREPLTEANGFMSQADVLIETRRAADLLGATPMDRPEDIEPNPVTGTVFAVFTNNTKRTVEQVDAANPRADNAFGHIIELVPPGGPGPHADHAAEAFTWEMFIRCGDPAKPEAGARYPGAVTADGWFATPDNLAFDSKSRLWIATDGATGSGGFADGLWACELDGADRGKTRHFFRVPIGAEACGPCFTPDDTALFVAVQHPAEGKESSFEKPLTRWPDFAEAMPPRPSVVVITRDEGGPIT